MIFLTGIIGLITSIGIFVAISGWQARVADLRSPALPRSFANDQFRVGGRN